MGTAHARAGNHQAAVKAFRKVVELDPHLHMVYYTLGISLSHLGQMEEAKKNLEMFRSLQADAEEKEYRELQIEVAGRTDLQVARKAPDEGAPVTVPLPLSLKGTRTTEKGRLRSQANEVFSDVTREAGIVFGTSMGPPLKSTCRKRWVRGIILRFQTMIINWTSSW